MADYLSLFNFHNYPGLVSSRLHEGIAQYIFYFSLLVVLTLPLFIRKVKVNKIRRAEYIFLIFLYLIFIIFFNFSLGPNSNLTGKEWQWLFDYFPGFGFFRSFTRFLMIPLISIIFIFGVFLKGISLPNNTKIILISAGILILLASNTVFFTGNFQGAVGTINVPKEYYNINEKYFKNDKENFTIISLPNLPYEAYKWSINPNTDIFTQITYFDINFFFQTYRIW